MRLPGLVYRTASEASLATSNLKDGRCGPTVAEGDTRRKCADLNAPMAWFSYNM